GVVVTVSHDRYFLDRVVHHLLVFEGNGHISHFYGNYHDYTGEEQSINTERDKEKMTSGRTQVKIESQRPQSKKLSYNEQKEWETIEEDIMTLENTIELLKQEISEAGSDLEKVQEKYEQQQAKEKELDEKYERWEELSIRMEQAKNK